MQDVARDPDDERLVRRAAVAVEEVLAERARDAAEELHRERLVDEADLGRARAVAGVEVATGEEPDAERVEIAGRGDVPDGEVLVLRIGDVEAHLASAGERNAGGERRLLHAGRGVETALDLAEDGAHFFRRVVALRRKREHRRQDVVATKADVDLRQMAEGAQRQAGADEQHQRQRHLDDDERGAQPAVRHAGDASASRPP